MNKDQFAGKWREMKGKVKEQWGKLTDDDMTRIDGRWDQLSGRLQERYGWEKDRAEKEMNTWYSTYDKNSRGRSTEENRFSSDMGEDNRSRKNEFDSERKRNDEDNRSQHDKDKKRKAG